MKYGQNFEKESVPEWSLHNIDYNSLKHHIKVHTTRDQASAISIPGHQDTSLRKFEDELFLELCRQHDRVDLFVSTKANELSRRLQHLSEQIHKLLVRCATSCNGPSPKRQRRFQKVEHELEQCGDDILALRRFINAQVIGFRKILKKYRKWTGSATLGSRFRDTVLSHPKSFSRRDFSYLQSQCNTLFATLRAATPTDLGGASTTNEQGPSHVRDSDPNETQSTEAEGEHDSHLQLQLPEPAVPSLRYWNEYDNGSEAGDLDRTDDGAYAIYINPDDSGFPGWETLSTLFRIPLDKTRSWFAHAQIDPPSEPGVFNGDAVLNANPGVPRTEQSPLLIATTTSSYGTTHSYRQPSSAYTSPTVNGSSYHTSPPFRGSSSLNTETDDDQPFLTPFSDHHTRSHRKLASSWSDDAYFPAGYEAHYAANLPSVEEQRIARYRERLLVYGTLGAFAAAFVFMGVAAVLILTGRHKLRAEVDAGVIIGVCASLASGCAALALNMNRRGAGGWVNWLLVSLAFVTLCVLNGGLLVMVVGNTAL